MTRIAMIGCGVVGQGLLKILRDKKQHLNEKYGFNAELVAVSDKFKGSIMVSQGIDLETFIQHLERKEPIGEFKADGAVYGLDPVDTICRTDADTVIELSFTDVKTGEPAATHIRTALKNGKNVVTTNKGPSALFHRELATLARENGVFYKHEGTVMSGTPIFSLLDYTLAGNTVKGFKGLLNGTTNFILTKMELEGMSYQDALALAQKLGYAEADPTADVEGYDALAKVLILSNVILGGELKEADVHREGITGISLDDIKNAAKEGKRYKLVGSAKMEGGMITASVAPQKLSLTDPLAGVSGANNAVTFETDLMGPVTIQGAGAGQIETGFSVLIDLMNIEREQCCSGGCGEGEECDCKGC